MSTTEKKLPIIKTDTQDFADKIAKEIKIDKAGTATITEGVYVANLPEGITEETITAVRSYDTNFAAASLLALGRNAAEAMKKNKELDTVALSIPATGKDSFELQYKRSKEKTVTAEDGSVSNETRYGAAQVRFDMYGTGNRGQLKAVKENLAAEALAAFGK